MIPLFFGDVFAGFVGLDSCKRRRDWSKDEIFLLEMFIDLLSKALTKNQLQEEIAQSKQNFHNFFDRIDDMLFILDSNARIQYVNRTLIKKTGFQMEELVGKSFVTLHPPYQHEEARSLIFAILSGACHSCKILFYTKDGAEIPVSVHVSDGQWNGKPAFFGVAHDVSLLQFSEEKFFKAFDDSFLMKVIINASDASIIDANKAFCSTLGYEITEVLGKTPIDIQLLADVEAAGTIHKAFFSKSEIEDAELVIQGKDKVKRTILMSASPIEVGKLSCFIVSMLDISERKRMETEIKEYSEHLEVLVQQKVHEISEALWGTITSLVSLTESRDGVTGAHIRRLSESSRSLSKCLRERGLYAETLTDEFIEYIQEAITLHDIGKVGIRDSILLKPGKLTPAEFEEMKTHTTIGAQTLREAYQYYPGNKIIQMAIDIAASHHERWDGTGYPDSLKGEEIPLSAQIAAVCDVYDAIRSRRSYKPAMTHSDGLREIQAESGTHFNPVIVEAFRACEKEIAESYEQSPQ